MTKNSRLKTRRELLEEMLERSDELRMSYQSRSVCEALLNGKYVYMLCCSDPETHLINTYAPLLYV